MPRQRARCRNPDCGTYALHGKEAQVNDTTIAGFYKGIMLTLNFVVLFGALGLGALALTTSFKWVVAIGAIGVGGLVVLHVLEQRLDAFATITYRYRCALCGKAWGDGGMAADAGNLEHDPVAA